MVKRKREIGDGWMQSRIILGPVRWFIILSTVIIVMVPYKVLLLPPVTLPVFSMPTNMDWKGSGSQGVEFSRRRVGHTEFSSLCRLSTWNSIMAQNVTRYTMRGAGDEVRSDCGDAFMLRISKGGRSNPMHNLHDSILPFVFFVRLCGTPHDTIVLPILSTNSGGEPKYEWLPSFLGVIFNSMITDGKIVSKQDAAENSCFKTVTKMQAHYQVPFHDQCSSIKDSALKEICKKERIGTLRDINQYLRAMVKNRNENDTTTTINQPQEVKILVYDRTIGNLSGRQWINSAESIERLKELPNVVVQYIPNFELPPLEQCSLVAAADIFVTPHGGVLANLLCIRDGAGLVEVKKKCTSNEVQWHQALREALNIKHEEISCVAQDNRETTVDADDVVRAVRRMIRRL